MRFIPRRQLENELRNALTVSPITALLGPRQAGKTTLARRVAGRNCAWFDLEDPLDLARLEAPRTVLGRVRGLVVIDEIQLRPDLFPLLRVLADRAPSPARFLILGSASPALVQQASESLAGRVRFVDMGGFHVGEVGADQALDLWIRGGLPPSFLAVNPQESFQWRLDFIRTYLTRDLPQYGISLAVEQMRRFWTMLAHYHGQTWNASEIAGALGVTYKTTRKCLDVLVGSYMAWEIQAWNENVGKRLRKAPRVYLRDSGLLFTLLNLHSIEEVEAHPRLGAFWEGFGVGNVLGLLRVQPGEAYYWSTHGGAEVDLLLHRHGRRVAFEFKYSDAPRTTKSMRIAFQDLRLDELYVVYPGERDYDLDEHIHVLSLSGLVRLAASGI